MKNKSGFTLIEVVSIVAIISIVAIGGAQINFNFISNKQKLEIFNSEISNFIETVRNNSLLGKGAGAALVNPEQWRIDVTANGEGNIKSYYLDGTWIEADSITGSIMTISKFSCSDLNSAIELSYTGSEIGTIIFEGGNSSLSGACSGSDKILRIETENKGQFKNVEFNSVSGLISTN